MVKKKQKTENREKYSLPKRLLWLGKFDIDSPYPVDECKYQLNRKDGMKFDDDVKVYVQIGTSVYEDDRFGFSIKSRSRYTTGYLIGHIYSQQSGSMVSGRFGVGAIGFALTFLFPTAILAIVAAGMSWGSNPEVIPVVILILFAVWLAAIFYPALFLFHVKTTLIKGIKNTLTN